MKKILFVLLAALACAPFAKAEDDPLPPSNIPSVKPEAEKPWFRNAAEYLTSRSVRPGAATEVNSKIISDGKRFDVSLGKRINLYHWGEKSLAETWSIGVDGGMLASLTRYKYKGQLTFATNTFDGYFGAYIGHIWDGWLTLFRYGHLSAHLVDSSPDIFNPVLYSQFWGEFILGKTFPKPLEESNWEVHLQSSVGLNNTSSPKANQPRASFNMSGGYSPGGPDTIAIIASADALNPGVTGQKPTYAMFLGAGSLNRPNSTQRPYRFGLAYVSGSDYRNQCYAKRQHWTTVEVSTEF
ncbi:MAG: hypothetical protein ACXVBE_13830 [Bdellovibrionota bacterium]